MEIQFGYWNYSGEVWKVDIPKSHIKYKNNPLCNPSFNRPSLKFVATNEDAIACQECLKIYISGDMPEAVKLEEYPMLRLGI